MTIGLLTAHFPPKANAAAVRLQPFVEVWSEEGSAVHVFTQGSNGEADALAESTNVHLHRAPFTVAGNRHSVPVRALSEAMLCIFIFWKVLRSKIDVLVFSSPPFLVAVTTFLLARLTNTPYVADIRDLYPEVLFNHGVVRQDGLFGRLLRQMEVLIYENALFVSTVTEGLRQHIEKRTDTEVFLARNGVDSSLFFRESTESRSDTFKIIFHGTLGRNQNVDLIVRYARFLKREGVEDIKINVIGDGPKRGEFESAVMSYELADIITLVGKVDFENIPSLLNQADLGFSPLIDSDLNDKAFSVKVYEYLGCGLPVISTAESAQGRFIEEHRVGFQLSNDDLGAIHAAVLQMKNEPNTYFEYSNRAVRVAGNFDRREIGRELHRKIRHRLKRANGRCRGGGIAKQHRNSH